MAFDGLTLFAESLFICAVLKPGKVKAVAKIAENSEINNVNPNLDIRSNLSINSSNPSSMTLEGNVKADRQPSTG